MGVAALQSNTGGNQNTAVGQNALQLSLTGNNNLALGANAGHSLVTGSNNIYIASDAVFGTENNVTRIANVYGTTTTNPTGAIVYVSIDGQLGTATSTRKAKHNIEDMNDESAVIYNLRPVTFAYNQDASETKQYGLIAEEVEAVSSDLILRDKNGDLYSVRYDALTPLMLNEMQKQYHELLNHKALIAQLAERLDALEAIN
jgi:hypothetical protein